MFDIKNILLAAIIAFSVLGLQYFLSTRKHFLWGLIIPTLFVIGGILFLIFEVKDGNYDSWIFRIVLNFCVLLSIYFEGRNKLKNNKKKELEKMQIKDL